MPRVDIYPARALERPEVLIIGAGLAGASLSWHLAGRRRVVLVEQGAQPFGEASAQNAGMFRRLVAGARERDLACRSHELLVGHQHHPDWRDAPAFRRTGGVVALAADAGPLPGAAADLAARGVAVEDLPRTRLAAVAPALRGAPVARAFWVPDDGVCDAWSLGQGFLRGALARGAQLLLDTRVVGLVVEGDRVTGIRTTTGVLRAGTVVLASGAWSAGLAATAGLRRELVPKARHLFQSTPHPLAHREHPWCWIDDAGLYLRPEAGGFLCSPCDAVPREPREGPGSAGPADLAAQALLADKLARFAPALAGLRFAGGWNGLRTFAESGGFLVGPDAELPGLFWLAGLGGAGVTCAFALGEFAAQALG